jgi:hypothetical protein
MFDIRGGIIAMSLLEALRFSANDATAVRRLAAHAAVPRS